MVCAGGELTAAVVRVLACIKYITLQPVQVPVFYCRNRNRNRIGKWSTWVATVTVTVTVLSPAFKEAVHVGSGFLQTQADE